MASIQNYEYDASTLQLTSRLLKQNPEFYTIWNHRRRILSDIISQLPSSNPQHTTGSLENPDSVISRLISNDLYFTLPLLRKFPKCYWIWNYRSWLLQQCNALLPSYIARQFWEDELTLVAKMHALDSRNFHGWGYRRGVVAALDSPALQIGSTENQVVDNGESDGTKEGGEKPGSLTEEEFEYTTTMLDFNLSNFSAWHRRSKVIPRLLDERNAGKDERLKLLDEDLEWIQGALWASGDDSSLWFYHQFLLSIFDPDSAESSIVKDITAEERNTYVADELQKVNDMLKGAEDCKWIYLALIRMGMLHRKLTGKWKTERQKLVEYIKILHQVDPLRAGRWQDLKKELEAWE
ncbi:uncharacterized protein KY384_004541 [Bacidia gigantensis]|uniref:uncharacterized protein n=1 Tax=Bacidia gigantensis TaxID=2732470 RepID=UPI001D04EF73|nr:uncharacterized protein KY384_004541 [Bacidia gigantensis]KAG8531183.1 hypothetical protein KY384_004541 [Bacidia gigantensis]